MRKVSSSFVASARKKNFSFFPVLSSRAKSRDLRTTILRRFLDALRLLGMTRWKTSPRLHHCTTPNFESLPAFFPHLFNQNHPYLYHLPHNSVHSKQIETSYISTFPQSSHSCIPRREKISLKKSVCVPTHQRDAAHVCIERQTERKIYFFFSGCLSSHIYILSLTLPQSLTLSQSLPLTLTLSPSPSLGLFWNRIGPGLDQDWKISCHYPAAILSVSCHYPAAILSVSCFCVAISLTAPTEIPFHPPRQRPPCVKGAGKNL